MGLIPCNSNDFKSNYDTCSSQSNKKGYCSISENNLMHNLLFYIIIFPNSYTSFDINKKLSNKKSKINKGFDGYTYQKFY